MSPTHQAWQSKNIIQSYNVYPWTMTLTLNQPWSNIRNAHRLIILDICAVICKSHHRFKRYRAEMIVCLTLNYHLDLEVTFITNALCKLSHGTLHLCQVISKCTQPLRVIERTRNTVIRIQCLTMNYDLDFKPTLV